MPLLDDFKLRALLSEGTVMALTVDTSNEFPRDS